MKIVVLQTGGFLGLDRRLEVDDGMLRIQDRGQTTLTSALNADQQGQIEALASRLAGVSNQIVSRHSLPSDGMATEIAIERGSGTQKLRVESGDSAPNEVWDFLRTVSQMGALTSRP